MNCSRCNSPINPDFSFCMNCGSPVDADATVVLSPQKQQTPPAQSEPAQPNPTPSTPIPSVQPPSVASHFDYTLDFPSLPETEHQKSGKKKKTIIIVIIILLLLLIVGAAAALVILDYTGHIDIGLPFENYSGYEDDADAAAASRDDRKEEADDDEEDDDETTEEQYEEATTAEEYFTDSVADKTYDPYKINQSAIISLTEKVNKYLTVSITAPGITYCVGDKNDLAGTSVYELTDGEVVYVYGYKGGYAYIKVGSYYGWCDSGCLTDEQEDIAMNSSDADSIINSMASQADAYYKVFDTGYSGLNLRMEPQTDSEVIKVLQESEIVLVYGIRDGWAFVKTDDPRTESNIYGWCSSEYLQYYSEY